VAYAHSKRDGSDFTPPTSRKANLINPIYIADRDRDKVKLMLDWAPAQPLTLTFNVEYAKDQYGHSDARPFGLTRRHAARLLDRRAYAITTTGSVNAWYTRDQTEANQFGQRSATRRGRGGEGGEPEERRRHVRRRRARRSHAEAQGRPRCALQQEREQVSRDHHPDRAGRCSRARAGDRGRPLPTSQHDLTRVNLYALTRCRRTRDLRFDYIYE
jgi:hypothetical protein